MAVGTCIYLLGSRDLYLFAWKHTSTPSEYLVNLYIGKLGRTSMVDRGGADTARFHKHSKQRPQSSSSFS